MNKAEVLESLLEWKAPLLLLEERMSALPWDIAEPPLTVTRQHLTNVLSQYLAGERTEIEIESWANLIEGRDDLTMDREVRDLIYRLANPFLEGKLSTDLAQHYIVSWFF